MTNTAISKGCAEVASFFYTQTQIERADDVFQALVAAGVSAQMEVFMQGREWLGYVVRFPRSLTSDRALMHI